MSFVELNVGSPVKVRIESGMTRLRIEDGMVTKVTKTRLHVQSGGRTRVFVRATGSGYGDNKSCCLLNEQNVGGPTSGES